MVSGSISSWVDKINKFIRLICILSYSVSYYIVEVVVIATNERPEFLMRCLTIINNLNDKLFYRTIVPPQVPIQPPKSRHIPLFSLTSTLKWSIIPEYVKCQSDYSTHPCHVCCFIVLEDAELHSLFASHYYSRTPEIDTSNLSQSQQIFFRWPDTNFV